MVRTLTGRSKAVYGNKRNKKCHKSRIRYRKEAQRYDSAIVLSFAQTCPTWCGCFSIIRGDLRLSWEGKSAQAGQNLRQLKQKEHRIMRLPLLWIMKCGVAESQGEPCLYSALCWDKSTAARRPYLYSSWAEDGNVTESGSAWSHGVSPFVNQWLDLSRL